MKLNPNLDKRNEILDKLKANNGYCPCAIVKNQDTKCKCKKMREENVCECLLFVK